MRTPYLRYSLSKIKENSAALRSMAQESGKQWAPHLTGAIPPAVLRSVRSYSDSASCRNVEDAERLASAGFQSVVLTRPVVDPQALLQLTAIATQTKITAVIDHFRHAELLSQAMTAARTSAQILIDVDLGCQVTGVRPGPDSVRLATAAAQLPGILLRGVFVDDWDCGSEPAAASESLLVSQSLAVAQHCRRMIEAHGLACGEIVTGRSSWKSAFGSECASLILANPMAAACPRNTRSSGDSAVELVCRVLSRPSIEWCVVDAGANALGSQLTPMSTRPPGARLKHSRSDISTLMLYGECLDLKIGDEVVIALDGNIDRPNLPTLVKPCVSGHIPPDSCPLG